MTPRWRATKERTRAELFAFAEKPKAVERYFTRARRESMRGCLIALAHAARSPSQVELHTAQRRRPSDVAQCFSHSAVVPAPTPARLSLCIAFDIDGVILQGRSLIGGSPRAICRLTLKTEEFQSKDC